MAFKVIKKTDPVPMRGVTGIFYGDIGIGKTTMATTADRVLLLSFEQGGLERAERYGDAVNVVTWDDMPNPKSGDLKEYSTIVIDTLAAAVGCCLHHIVSRDPKTGVGLKQTRKIDPRKDYSELARMFKAFSDDLNALGKDVIFIAHSEKVDVPTVGKGSIERIQPMGGEGKTKDYINRIVHFCAYMERDPNTAGLINVFFDAGATATTKDSYNMGMVEFRKGDDQFLSRILLEIRKRHEERQEKQAEANKAVDEILALIIGHIVAGDMTSELATELYRRTETDIDASLVVPTKLKIKEMYMEAGFVMDKATKSWIVPNPEPVTEVEPETAEPVEEAVYDEPQDNTDGH